MRALRRRRPPARRPAAAGLVTAACLALAACVDVDLFEILGTSPPNQDGSVLSYQLVFAGSTHGCALANGGRALCWGGTLGDNFAGSQLLRRVEGPQTFRTLDLSSFSCGVTTNDEAWCWGENVAGSIGDGTTSDREFPAAVLTTLRFREITVGSSHACGLTESGEIHCWGSNKYGQLSTLPDTLSLVPISVAPSLRFQTIDAGGLQTCGVEVSGDTYCWGGELGPAPTRIAGSIVFTRLTLGGTHACGLTGEGEAWCFGTNFEGQLGDGTFAGTPPAGPPVAVATGIRFTDLSAGQYHTCGLTGEGEAWCWGRDDVGQLGDGDPPGGQDPIRKPAPTLVQTNDTFLKFVSISAGRFTSCAAATRGRGFCWGYGTGSPSHPTSSRPVEIGT